ncbi:hypothetical protein NAH03_25140, partial [Stenotrophomonas maltophilia]|nr:hypothetical protein [Stenotrophomonas maltophilia]
MQVLVLAVQNAMPAQMYGVATSGVTLFRSIGGSIGVALFGAVFTHVLQSNLQQLLPEGAVLPPGMNPVAVQHLPADIRLDYLDAFGAAIHAAFLMAAGIMAVAFVLSWLLKECLLYTFPSPGNRHDLVCRFLLLKKQMHHTSVSACHCQVTTLRIRYTSPSSAL